MAENAPRSIFSATEAKAVDHALCKQIALSVVNIGGDLLSAEGQRDLALCYLAYAAALSRDSDEAVKDGWDRIYRFDADGKPAEQGDWADIVYRLLTKSIADFLETDGRIEALSADLSAAKAERDKAQADAENAVWNLAGCSTYALGYNLDEGHNMEMARPALNEVRELALKYRAAEAEALRLRTAMEHIAATVRTGEVDDQWCASMCDEALRLPGASKPEEGR